MEIKIDNRPETLKGKFIADLLHLKISKKGLVKTSYGNKTLAGLYMTLKDNVDFCQSN
jgi:hypothetical protein